MFLTISFCHRRCGSQKQNFTPPKAFATLALPGELLGATRCHRLEQGPLKDAELGSAPLLPTSSHKECLDRTQQARRGWPHDSVGLPTYSDRSAQKTSLSLSQSIWET